MTVSVISRINYYELIEPTLSDTQRTIYNIIKSYPNGISSYHLIKILGKEHHKFSGRLSDLVKLDLIRVDRTVTIDGSTFGVWVNNIDENGNIINNP